MQYPKRPACFAHKFVRLMHKTALASVIGRDAFALLTIIAHTEDAMRYRGPARFWNSQLIETLGFRKWEQFDAVRQKAIDSGWLHYENNGKAKAGEYFVVIPPGYDAIDDLPIETDSDHTEQNMRSYPKNGYKQGDDVGYDQGDLSIPNPTPNPNPKTQGEGTADAVVATATLVQTDTSGTGCPYTAIGNAFDATFGSRSRLTDKRRKAMQARWRDPWWRDNWQDALARAGPSTFLRGGNDRGWVIDLEFFVRPDTVAKILEGKYDNRTAASRPTTTQQRENNTADSLAIFERAAAARDAERLIAGSNHGGHVQPGVKAIGLQ